MKQTTGFKPGVENSLNLTNYSMFEQGLEVFQPDSIRNGSIFNLDEADISILNALNINSKPKIVENTKTPVPQKFEISNTLKEIDDLLTRLRPIKETNLGQITNQQPILQDYYTSRGGSVTVKNNTPDYNYNNINNRQSPPNYNIKNNNSNNVNKQQEYYYKDQTNSTQQENSNSIRPQENYNIQQENFTNYQPPLNSLRPQENFNNYQPPGDSLRPQENHNNYPQENYNNYQNPLRPQQKQENYSKASSEHRNSTDYHLAQNPLPSIKPNHINIIQQNLSNMSHSQPTSQINENFSTRNNFPKRGINYWDVPFVGNDSSFNNNEKKITEIWASNEKDLEVFVMDRNSKLKQIAKAFYSYLNLQEPRAKNPFKNKFFSPIYKYYLSILGNDGNSIGLYCDVRQIEKYLIEFIESLGYEVIDVTTVKVWLLTIRGLFISKEKYNKVKTTTIKVPGSENNLSITNNSVTYGNEMESIENIESDEEFTGEE